MKGNLLRWGFCCAGLISNDFAVAINTLDPSKHQLHAVAASKLEKAQEFAKKHGFKKSFGSYKELAEDPEVDVVYIGSIHVYHYEQTKMMLEAGKHVVCEKPMCLHPNQTKHLYKLAKSKKLFCMEAIWSRFFPAYTALKEALESGEIGEVRSLQCFIGFSSNKEDLNWERLQRKDLGGGALNDLGVYPFQLAQLIFKEKPALHQTSGFLTDTGVDAMSSVTLKYSNQRMATLGFANNCTFSNEAIIGGTKGMIKLHELFWCPTKITINDKEQNFELPKTNATLYYRNSTGLSYEADEIHSYIAKGMLESPLLTHDESIQIAEMIYKTRRDLGYDLFGDAEWDKKI